MTLASIAGVSRPVNVFCWLGWNEPTTVYGPTRASTPCPNLGRGRGTRVAEVAERTEHAVPAERTEGDDHPDPSEQGKLTAEERQAGVALVGRRLVGRRRAVDDGADPDAGQGQPVVPPARDR